MNRVMFIGCLVGIVIFIVFLAMTFVAQTWLKDFARDYINRRIEPSVTRAVAKVESAVLPSLAEHPELATRVTAEIAKYRTDPLEYIDRITSGRLPPQSPSEPGLIGTAAEVLKKDAKSLVSLQVTIGDHFRKVFDHLVFDLRIFAITNLLAFTVVAMLMCGYDVRSPRLLIQAFIPFLATCYGMTVYIKQDWFFNLLLDFHMGFVYPFFVIVTMLDLWIRWRGGQLRKRAEALTEEMFSG